jgi:HD-GYP domain-containing protein (c-di-GMP phosphodiesterase class II)
MNFLNFFIKPNIDKLKAKQDVPRLIELLEEKDREIRRSAVQALGELKDARAVVPLISLLENDWSSPIQQSVVQALAEIKDPRAITALINSLKSVVSVIKAGAVSALVQIGPPAVDQLIQALDEGDKNVQLGAVRALGDIKDPRALPKLIVTLKTDKEDLRSKVREALVKIDPDWSQSNAARLLVPTLIASLRDKNPVVRRNIIPVLGEIMDSQAVKPLMKALHDPDPRVQENAAAALMKFKGEEEDSRATWRQALPAGSPRMIQYLEQKLDNVLADSTLNNQEKVTLLYQLTFIWMRNFYSSEKARTNDQLRLAEKLIKAMYWQMVRDDHFSTLFIKLWQRDFYPYTHCLNITAIGLSFVTFLGWDTTEVQKFGLGCLLHDIGITKVSKETIKKMTLQKPLTVSESEEMKKHPAEGFRLLMNLTEIQEEIMFMVLQHHEEGGGSGYPDGIKMANMHLWAKILGIIDAFELNAAARPWLPGRTSQEILRIMNSECEKKGKYDPEIFYSFCKFWSEIKE